MPKGSHGRITSPALADFVVDKVAHLSDTRLLSHSCPAFFFPMPLNLAAAQRSQDPTGFPRTSVWPLR